MTVEELIALLLTFPKNLPVAYRCWSEQVLLQPHEIREAEHCEPRPDGWIQNLRPDMPSKTYLLFPGN